MAFILGLALTTAFVAGCRQPLFNTECDDEHYRTMINMPSDLDSNPTVANQPSPFAAMPTPTNVLDPDRPVRYISLQECIAIALEQGSYASVNNGPSNSPTAAGAGGVRLREGLFIVGPFQPAPLLDSVRVMALQPAIAQAEIEHALSRFDAVWVSNMTWSFTDVPFGGTQLAFLQTRSPLIGQSTYRAVPTTSLIKPLPTGGTAGLTFSVPYTNQNPAFGRLNPAYAPNLHFGFEQPLLQGFGVEINQLRARHPGAFLDQNLQNPLGNNTRDGIVLARIRFDQNRANFEANIQAFVANIEAAYWQLYGSYAQLYAREQALIQALYAWRLNSEKLKAGTLRIADQAQSRGQYELFRGDRLEALSQVLEAERTLRGFLGMPVEDGTRLVPSDQPTIAPYRPDWQTSLQETLALKPDLVLAREQVKLRQLELIRERNSLLPDVRFVGQYEINSLGQSLSGPAGPAGNAFANLASNRFNNWTLGLQASIPLGFRAAHADVRISRLNLAQSYYTLRDAEYRATNYLALQWRTVVDRYELIQSRRAQREAFAQQVQARFLLFQAGAGRGPQGEPAVTLDILLEAQRFWADALAREAAAIVDYNVALANFEYAKGTILQHNSITIGEGPLPACAAVRARDHLEERTRALVLLERPIPYQPLAEGVPGPGLPQFTPGMAPSLPSLFMSGPRVPLSDRPEELPTPRPEPALPRGLEPLQNGPTLPPTSARPATPAPSATEKAAPTPGSTAAPTPTLPVAKSAKVDVPPTRLGGSPFPPPQPQDAASIQSEATSSQPALPALPRTGTLPEVTRDDKPIRRP